MLSLVYHTLRRFSLFCNRSRCVKCILCNWLQFQITFVCMFMLTVADGVHHWQAFEHSKMCRRRKQTYQRRPYLPDCWSNIVIRCLKLLRAPTPPSATLSVQWSYWYRDTTSHKWGYDPAWDKMEAKASQGAPWQTVDCWQIWSPRRRADWEIPSKNGMGFIKGKNYNREMVKK